MDAVVWPDGGDDGDDAFNSGELIFNSFWILLFVIWFYSAYLPIQACVVGRLLRPEGLSPKSSVEGDVALPLLRHEDAYIDDSDLYYVHGKEQDKAEWTLRTQMQTSAAVVDNAVGDGQEKREMNRLSLASDRLLASGSKLTSTPNRSRISVPTSTVVSHTTTSMVTQGDLAELLYSGAAAPTAGSSGVPLQVRGTVLSTASLSASSVSSGSSSSSSSHVRSRLEAMLESASSGQSWTPSSSSRSTSGAAGTQAFKLAVHTGSKKSTKWRQILPGALVGGIVFLAMVVAVGTIAYHRRRRRRQEAVEAEEEAARRGMVRQSLPSQWWW